MARREAMPLGLELESRDLGVAGGCGLGLEFLTCYPHCMARGAQMRLQSAQTLWS